MSIPAQQAASSPFVPGARVAIDDPGGHLSPVGYKEGTVEKVYKTGHFTLKGSPQRWRVHEPCGHAAYWRASMTGDHRWSRAGALRIWDDAADVEIRDAISARSRYDRFTLARDEMARRAVRSWQLTDEMVNQLEAIVAALRESKK